MATAGCNQNIAQISSDRTSDLGTYRSVATSRDPSDNPVAKRSRPRRIAGVMQRGDEPNR